MKRDLTYRLAGYVLGAMLLWYAFVNVGIWLFWKDLGYLDRYYPAWWLPLTTAMALMAVVLFLPSTLPQRHCGRLFKVTRSVLAVFLIAFFWHYGRPDAWIFHDWIAHPYLGDCSGAHGGNQFLVFLAAVVYAAVPGISWALAAWKRRKAELSRAEMIAWIRRSAVAGAVVLLTLAITTALSLLRIETS